MIVKLKLYLNVCFLALILLFSLLQPASAMPVIAQTGGQLPVGIIFDSDTSDEYIAELYGENNPDLAPFYLLPHWNPVETATDDGASSAQGESLTLTWSIIPDGTIMTPAYVGEPTCGSSLIADMDAAYGAGNWRVEIENVFDDWSSKTANKYVYESNDDGAAWPETSGSLGKRGDLRIGGCTIDGNSGILAYNYFPSNGDMKIDSLDSFYSGNLTTGFHNVISHEHGHGAGVAHVCPVNQTKLMEPYISYAFTGLQHDDIRAIQRQYGDRNELIGGLNNDVAVRSTGLGLSTYNVPVDITGVSIDDNSDQDWYSFSVVGGSLVDVVVTPIGSTYLNGPQNANGSCTDGTLYDSLAVHNLDFEVIDSDGTTVLATSNASNAGLSETLDNVSLGLAGVKFIRVYGDSTDDIQLYDLGFTVEELPPQISVTPSSLTPSAQQPDAQRSGTLTIQNIGGGDLIWTIDEAPLPIVNPAVVRPAAPVAPMADMDLDALCDVPGDLSWLSVSPAAGTTASGPGNDVTVTFDSTGLANGLYEATLCVNSNDGVTPVVEVPVEMLVDTTVAVTIGYVSSSRSRASVDFYWQTATETDSAGFNILVEDGELLGQLNEELIASRVIDSISPVNYRYSVMTDALTFYIEEVDISGNRTQDGPFLVGVDYGSSSPVETTNQHTIWLPSITR